MIDGLKPYPAYKDSGVPWLGKVPEHWDARRLKTFAKLNPSRAEVPYELRLGAKVAFLPMEQAGSDGRVDFGETRDVASVWTGFTYFRRGDVLVAKITPCFENGKGVCLDRMPTPIGFGSTEFHVLRAQPPTAPQFLYRISMLPEFRELGADAMTGAAGQQRVPGEFVAGFIAPLPPVPEQAAIVRFLDHADRRIQRYIRAKRKLIALLNEQKQAIIQRAVTRGLDPNVRLKPSGVEWLGDLPEHWEVRRLKHLFGEVDTRSVTGSETLLSLRMNRGLVPHSEVSMIPISSSALIGFKRVSPGQIVMNRMRAAIGMFGVATLPGLVSPDYAVLEPRGDIVAAYFLNLFRTRAAATVFRLESKGLGTGSSGFMRLYTDRFGAIKVSVPPVEEQLALVAALESETEEANRAMARIEREIDLIREYRARLISDVVTGKVDVREAAANIPEEPDESETYDMAQAQDESEGESVEEVEVTPKEAEV